MAGLDPIRFLETDDPVLRITMQAISSRIFEIRAEAARENK